jgi:hypothetical protein
MIWKMLAGLVLVVVRVFSASAGERVARVAIFSSGAVHLKKLKADNGAVWYHRQKPAREPPPQGTAVIQLIIKHQLPVSMSTRPDFSDYVDEKGVSRPRSR